MGIRKCRRGHVIEGARCQECNRARQIAWIAKNPEKAAESRRKYRNSDRGRALQKARDVAFRASIAPLMGAPVRDGWEAAWKPKDHSIQGEFIS